MEVYIYIIYYYIVGWYIIHRTRKCYVIRITFLLLTHGPTNHMPKLKNPFFSPFFSPRSGNCFNVFGKGEGRGETVAVVAAAP